MTEATVATADINNALLDMVMDSGDVEQFLSGLTRMAVSTLSPHASGQVLCAVTLLRPRKNGTVGSSSEHAKKMDEIQYNFGDGPCLRSAREGYTVHVPDMPNDDRFPEYRDAVAKHGILSALGVPVPLDGEARAGLNVYSTAAHAFDDEAVAEAEAFAKEASIALRLAVRMAHLSDTSRHLEAAMESRTTIDLAAGIIMAQNRCAQDEAVKILKAASSARNIKLRDIAADIVASTGQGPAETHFEA